MREQHGAGRTLRYGTVARREHEYENEIGVLITVQYAYGLPMPKKMFKKMPIYCND